MWKDKLTYFAAYIAKNSLRGTITEGALIKMAVAFISDNYKTNASLDEITTILGAWIWKARQLNLEVREYKSK